MVYIIGLPIGNAKLAEHLYRQVVYISKIPIRVDIYSTFSSN